MPATAGPSAVRTIVVVSRSRRGWAIPDGFWALQRSSAVNNPTRAAGSARGGDPGTYPRRSVLVGRHTIAATGLVGRSVSPASRCQRQQPPDLASLSGALSEGHRGGGYPHHAAAAAADEVSAPSRSCSVRTAKNFALSAQASAFHDRSCGPWVALQRAGVDAEAANAALVDTRATGASELGRSTARFWGPPTPQSPLRLHAAGLRPLSIAPSFLGVSGLYTPAQFQPWTGTPA